MKSMNKILILVSLTFCLSGIFAMEIPVSSQSVLTDDNMFSSFVRVDPDDQLPESLQTRFWLWQDGNDLMVHIEAAIDSTFEPGTFSNDESSNNGDMLRIQLVTMPKSYMAYAFLAYPLGGLCDGVRTQSMGIDYAWDSNYSYTSDIGADTWTVRMRIPLGSLRFKQELPYNWRIIFTRYHYYDYSTYSSPYAVISQKSGYFMSSHPITLTTAISKDFPLIVKPYYVKSYDLVNHSSSYDPQNVGLDLQYAPSTKLRVKIALNPDFSDVPMDDAQDNYNSKYAPYYPENRFFFTEDLQVFDLDDSFYTRNIVQPQLAYKVTGNTKAVNWGILGAWDRQIKAGENLINPDDYYQAISVNPSWHNLSLKNSLISRLNDGFYNLAYYGKYQYDFPQGFSISTQNLLATQKGKGEAKAHYGLQQIMLAKYEKGNFQGSLGYIMVSKDLVHDAGYINDVDYDGPDFSFRWNKSSPNAFVSSKGIDIMLGISRSSLDKDFYDLHSAFVYAHTVFKKKLLLYSNFSSVDDLALDNQAYHSWRAEFGFSYTPKYEVMLGARYGHGQSLIFSLSEVHQRDSAILMMIYRLARKLSLNYSGQFTLYGYPKNNFIELDGITIPITLDNNYSVHNLGLTYTHSKKFDLSAGASYSNYESSDYKAMLSYYTNLKYQFLPNQYIYLGIKSQQSQMEELNWDNPLPQYRKDAASAYLKLALTM